MAGKATELHHAGVPASPVKIAVGLFRKIVVASLDTAGPTDPGTLKTL
jgi:hypothetical protein